MAEETLPLVYSCSGCSNAAQLCNALALRLQRRGLAEMSCIAGVGGGVKPLVRLARRGRPILALDGCPLRCVVACLERAGVRPGRHVLLSDLGVTREAHADVDPQDVERLWPAVAAAAEELAGRR